jgi:hypothetical protein
VTPFGEILRRAVEATPGAIGGAFADKWGEMIDSFATWNAYEWAVLTAHYGVVLSQLHSAFGTFHFGEPEYFIVQHSTLGIVVHTVDRHYYALLAVSDPTLVSSALTALQAASTELLREMWL